MTLERRCLERDVVGDLWTLSATRRSPSAGRLFAGRDQDQVVGIDAPQARRA
jgi:hypothetical protein